MGALFHFFQVPLYRELSVVALIILLVVVYYFRYVHFAKLSDTRLHRRWLEDLVRGTRRVMIVLVVALVGLVVFDRVILPRQGVSSAQAVKSSSSRKRTPAKSSSAHAETTSKKAKNKAKASQSSRGEIIDASEHSLTTQQYHDLLIVKNYYDKNSGDTNSAAQYRYRGQAVGNAGIKVTEIGGYRELSKNRLKLTHVYWVYPSGKFDVQH